MGIRKDNMKRGMILAVVLCFSCGVARGLETDQFTTPDKPLRDVGRVVSERVVEILGEVIDEANEDIASYKKKLREADTETNREYCRKKIQECLSADAIAVSFYRKTGAGLPECLMEKWLADYDFGEGADVFFKPAFGECVVGIPLTRPLILTGMAPTIRMYDHYLGTDKIGHFFQQGYEYYQWYHEAADEGKTPEECCAYAVEQGTSQEKGFYGMFLSGIYSNADMAADYSGLKFYLNLTQRVAFGGYDLPPMLKVEKGRWEFNRMEGSSGDDASRRGAQEKDRLQDVLEPFISDHLNEALNPSKYEAVLRATVKLRVEQNRKKIIQFYGSTPEKEAVRLKALSTWYGEEYGHSGMEDLVTISNTCFNDETKDVKSDGNVDKITATR